MAVSAKDIATALGVSPATVSLVLRDRPGIGEKTRARVLLAAHEMGYAKKPTPVVAKVRQSIQFVLYKKHGNVVGDTLFFAQLIQRIDAETKKHGYNLLLTYFYENQNIEEQMQALESSACAGVLLLATEMAGRDFLHFKKLSAPIVILDSYFSDERYDSVSIGNIYGAKHAVDYLISCGHSEIGYLCSSVQIQNFLERGEGYLKGIKTIPVLNNSRRYIIKVEPTVEGAYRDMAAHLAKRPAMPTAFFADNDIIAISCIRALKNAGYHIPEDISVIGFDDIETGELTEPPLTTMQVPRDQLAVAAVNRLLEYIEGKAIAVMKMEVNTRLIERRSVKNI